MRPGLIRITIVVVLLSFLFGCANKGDQTKAEGAGFGALIGAGVGALAGAALGGKNGAATGALIGAALGGVGGYAVGSNIVERQKQYANEEDRLDGEIKYAVEQNNNLDEYNKGTAKELDKLEKQLADTKSDNKQLLAKAALTSNDRNKYLKGIETDKSNKTKLQNELSALTEYKNSVQQTGDQDKIVKLGKEIDTLRQNIAMLDSNNIRMAQVVTALPVKTS